MIKLIPLILITLVITSCGKDDDQPAPAPAPIKYVYCSTDLNLKLCEVRTEHGPSIFDVYTNVVPLGTVNQVNVMLQNNNSNTRLKP